MIPGQLRAAPRVLQRTADLSQERGITIDESRRGGAASDVVAMRDGIASAMLTERSCHAEAVAIVAVVLPLTALCAACGGRVAAQTIGWSTGRVRANACPRSGRVGDLVQECIAAGGTGTGRSIRTLARQLAR
ncbi:hypothetical protein XAP6164_2380034 [Xanthomonas phaseoli pv. phaseoli]|nr:hypothetical protein XAP6164_2380034 [Xanthomonas phaseoli pv. phaseoli]